MKTTSKALALGLALLAPMALTVAAGEPPRFIHFQRETVAIANGKTVLAALQPKADRTAAQRLVGSQVVFIGGTAPTGGNADLILGDGTKLLVVLTRQVDVRPHAVMWEAEAFGKLTKIDFEHRVITISCQP